MIFSPTHLYIKEHNITGLKYSGKTVRNPEVFKGSDSHWTNLMPDDGTIEETRQKISQSHTGKVRSKDNRRKLNVTAKSSIKLEYPHCNKKVDIRNAARWHSDNCKGG